MAKIQLIFDGEIRKEYELNKVETTIGRNFSNDIVIDNMGVSSKHAVIQFKDDKYFLKDLDSTNGTKLNGNKISMVELTHGDHINLFKHVLNFVLVSKKQSDIPPESCRVDPDATIMLDARQLNNMVSAYKTKKKNDDNNAFVNQPVLKVTSVDDENTIVLSNKPIIIGKKENCQIQTGGWLFTPKISAVINKNMSGMFIIKPETTIKLNGKKTREKHILKNGDQILIKNTLIAVLL